MRFFKNSRAIRQKFRQERAFLDSKYFVEKFSNGYLIYNASFSITLEAAIKKLQITLLSDM